MSIGLSAGQVSARRIVKLDSLESSPLRPRRGRAAKPRSTWWAATRACACFSLVFLGAASLAQPGPGGPPPQRSPREAAQVDLTGYWVALVTEDWPWRMITPPKGDMTSVPLNEAGKSVAGEWDLERDNAAGEQCRPFGAAGVMRMPLRLHITWQDDETLKIETDAGQQTRLFHFRTDAPAPADRTWQGYSTAAWTRPVGGFDLRTVFGAPAVGGDGPPQGSLKVLTRNLRAGYLRKNGVPYSENAQLTEYFSRISTLGNDYLTVLSVVHDPTYLMMDFVTSSQFKREPDASNWSPSPCRTAPPRSSAGE